MKWDPAMSKRINQYFESGDLTEFVRLLRKQSQYLRSPEGTDMWMWRAAMDGRLETLKALVELGLGVNETWQSEDPEIPDDDTYQVEGPILQAAGNGHLETVRWLLEHGAKINYSVKGIRRCWPLVHAATNGHLEVVKLLVQHGADVNATWKGVNAITQAEDYGHFNVRDYLHSLGARTLRETTPPDYDGAHKRFLKDLTRRVGPVGSWHEVIPGDPLVKLHLIPANDKCELQTLFTVGLSDHRLPKGEDAFACTELRCILPANWQIDGVARNDTLWNWPVEWLRRIVVQLRETDRWPEEPAIFMNGDPPAPLAPNTLLSGWICLKSQGESVKAADYRWIDIHSVFPIYAEEATLARQSGQEELINRLQARNAPLSLDPARQNVVT